jgi:two-component system, NtrC family, response regulator AtoC
MKILLVDDEKPLRDMVGTFLKKQGHEIESAASVTEGLEKVVSARPDMVLLDLNLPDGTGLDFLKDVGALAPDLTVVLVTAHVDVKTAVEAIKRGAEDYLTKPVDFDDLEFTIKRVREKLGLRREVAALKSHQKELYRKDYLFLSDPQMKKVYEQIEQISQQPSVTALILGETGTGKEHVAKLLHVLSPRTAAPFLELHCGAMPENLLESELFGYEPGAFTDARRSKPGLFEVANGGTVFLDEVGELPLSVQTKLLKVLEQKTLRRLGGVKETKIDVRVVAATNRDLKQEVQEGRFRADLYYRLNVASIVLPPLRSRPEDIRGLAQFFFGDLCQVFSKKLKPLSTEVLEVLVSYSWPGNVRELKNVLERAVLYAKGAALTVKDLPQEVLEPPAPVSIPGALSSGKALSRDEAEKENIEKALKAFKGNRTRVAEYLGVSRTTLLTKIKKYNLE